MKLAIHSHGGGNGRPEFVFLHGWGLSARVWSPLVSRLSRDFACHCVDLPGHGDSPDDGAGLNNWVDAVVASVARPAVYVGWSLGGLVALGAARRHPQQVQGLALVAVLARMVRSAEWPWGLKPSGIEATRRGLAADFSTTLSEFLMQQVLGEPGAARAVRSLRNDLIDQPPRLAGLARGLDILHEADFRATLGQIEQPALLLGGARDRMVHPDGMAWMAERLPNAEFQAVARAAHAPFLSHERQIADALRMLSRRVDCRA